VAAAGHGRRHPGRNLIDVVQAAIEAKAHDSELPARLHVEVARALLERVLPEPIDDGDDVLVVRVEAATAAAELHQLLEVVLDRARAVLLRALDGAREIEELAEVALQLE